MITWWVPRPRRHNSQRYAMVAVAAGRTACPVSSCRAEVVAGHRRRLLRAPGGRSDRRPEPRWPACRPCSPPHDGPRPRSRRGLNQDRPSLRCQRGEVGGDEVHVTVSNEIAIHRGYVQPDTGRKIPVVVPDGTTLHRGLWEGAQQTRVLQDSPCPTGPPFIGVRSTSWATSSSTTSRSLTRPPFIEARSPSTATAARLRCAKCSIPRTTDALPVRSAPPIEFVPTTPSWHTNPAAAPSRSIAEAVRAGAHRSMT
jgi:hypothetical protein